MGVNILGMMSGTSFDGIDAAMMCFDYTGRRDLLWYDSVAFSPKQFRIIKSFTTKRKSLKAITLGHAYVAEIYAKVVRKLCDAHNCEMPDYIAAHGQTIYHAPNRITFDGFELSGTLQLLDASRLAVRTGSSVISDFRSADMAVNGQGAPLVPFAEFDILAPKAKRDMVVLNIGGIANITFIRVPCGVPYLLKAFDTGPGNALIDAFMQSNTADRCDIDGQTAAKGKTNQELLKIMLDDDYFHIPPPKSTGKEYFNYNWVLNKIKRCGIRPSDNKNYVADIVSTLTDLTVESIFNAIEKYCEGIKYEADLVVSGGGVFNAELMRRLKERVQGKLAVSLSDDWGIPTRAKEAMAFAVLGYALITNRTGNVPRATGAYKKVLLGGLYPAPPRPWFLS